MVSSARFFYVSLVSLGQLESGNTRTLTFVTRYELFPHSIKRCAGDTTKGFYGGYIIPHVDFNGYSGSGNTTKTASRIDNLQKSQRPPIAGAQCLPARRARRDFSEGYTQGALEI